MPSDLGASDKLTYLALNRMEANACQQQAIFAAPVLLQSLLCFQRMLVLQSSNMDIKQGKSICLLSRFPLEI
jgi:hypothetical protein